MSKMSRHMLPRQLAALVALIVLSSTAIPTPSHAQQPLAEPSKEYARTNATPLEIAGDLLIVRPTYLAATMVGAGFFTISLPFTAWGDNMEHAAEAFVRRPARYTFTYPLGTF